MGGDRLWVVTEFGELGIDRKLLLDCGDAECDSEEVRQWMPVVHSCRGFLPAPTRLLERDNAPEHILIETSGLALPKPSVQASEVRVRTSVDGVLTLSNAAAVGAGSSPPIPRRSRGRAH